MQACVFFTLVLCKLKDTAFAVVMTTCLFFCRVSLGDHERVQEVKIPYIFFIK